MSTPQTSSSPVDQVVDFMSCSTEVAKRAIKYVSKKYSDPAKQVQAATNILIDNPDRFNKSSAEDDDDDDDQQQQQKQKPQLFGLPSSFQKKLKPASSSSDEEAQKPPPPPADVVGKLSSSSNVSKHPVDFANDLPEFFPYANRPFFVMPVHNSIFRNSVAFSHKSDLIAFASHPLSVATSNHCVTICSFQYNREDHKLYDEQEGGEETTEAGSPVWEHDCSLNKHKTLATLEQNNQQIHQVKFSDDDQFLASCTYGDSAEKQPIWVWKLDLEKKNKKNWVVHGRMSHPATVWGIDFFTSKTGSLCIAAASFDRDVLTFDVETLEKLHTCKNVSTSCLYGLAKFTNPFTKSTFLFAGGSCGKHGTFCVSAESGEFVGNVHAQKTMVNSIACSVDGKITAVCGTWNPSTVEVYDTSCLASEETEITLPELGCATRIASINVGPPAKDCDARPIEVPTIEFSQGGEFLGVCTTRYSRLYKTKDWSLAYHISTTSKSTSSGGTINFSKCDRYFAIVGDAAFSKKSRQYIAVFLSPSRETRWRRRKTAWLLREKSAKTSKISEACEVYNIMVLIALYSG